MTLNKDVRGFGMPWEDQYGYVQALKVDDTIYLSGQLSHDEHGNIVGAAPLDEDGNIRDHSNMEIQMRQTYANAKKILAEHDSGDAPAGAANSVDRDQVHRADPIARQC